MAPVLGVIVLTPLNPAVPFDSNGDSGTHSPPVGHNHALDSRAPAFAHSLEQSSGDNEAGDNNGTGHDNETGDENGTGDDNETADNNETADDNETADTNETADDNETTDHNGTGDDNETTDHNETGDDNETSDHNETGDDNETSDHNGTGDDNETSDHNGTGDDNETADESEAAGTASPNTASVATITTMNAPRAPLWFDLDDNFSVNGTFGSATWDLTNWTLTVSAGNFSWHGINCSWEAFTWSPGEDLFDALNITCDFWGLYTVVISNGSINITWSNGSWSHMFGAPLPPQPDFAFKGGLAMEPSARATVVAPLSRA